MRSSSELPVLVYTVGETATILKTSQKTVYRLINRGLLKASKALRHIRITKTSIEAFLDQTTGEGSKA